MIRAHLRNFFIVKICSFITLRFYFGFQKKIAKGLLSNSFLILVLTLFQIVLYFSNKSSLKKTLWPLFMDGIQLSQGCRANKRRQYSFNQPRKNERVNWRWRHPAVLNSRPLDWESSVLTTSPSSIKNIST